MKLTFRETLASVIDATSMVEEHVRTHDWPGQEDLADHVEILASVVHDLAFAIRQEMDQ